MTDGGDRLPSGERVADQLQHRLTPADVVWGEPAGYHDGVEAVRGNVRGRGVGLRRVSELTWVGLARLWADENDLAPALPEAVHRVPKLQLLVLLLYEDGDT